MNPKKAARRGPKDLVRRWSSVPRLYRVLGIVSVFYWAAFWVGVFEPDDTASSAFMALAIIGFWSLIAIAYLAVPIFAKSQQGSLSLRVPFTTTSIDIPAQRAVSQTALFIAPIAIVEVVTLAKVAESANPVCTILALVALLTLLKGTSAAEKAAQKYVLGEVVFARMNSEQEDGSHVRPAIVGGHIGPWLLLNPFTYRNEAGNREYVRFDNADWPELNAPEIYLNLTRVQISKPEQITLKAGEITDIAGRKLVEAAARIPTQVRHEVREELRHFVPVFDVDEHDIEVPLAFGDESAVRVVNQMYGKHDTVQRRRSRRAFVAAFLLTVLWIVLHKVGAVDFLLKHLDNSGPGVMVESVSALPWTVGVAWSLFVGLMAWAAVTWSAEIRTWVRDEVVGDLAVGDVGVRGTFDRYWQRVGKRSRRFLAAVAIGWLMSLTTSPSLTGCAFFLVFTFVAYVTGSQEVGTQGEL